MIQLFAAVIGAAIWIPYVLRSRRVAKHPPSDPRKVRRAPGATSLSRRRRCAVSARRPVAHVARGHGEAAAKGAMEIGHVVEAREIGDVAHLSREVSRIAQQPGGANQPLLQHELGKSRAGPLEQHLHIVRADTAALCDLGKAEIAIAEPGEHVRLDRLETSRGQSAISHKLGFVAAGAERKYHEIGQMLSRGILRQRVEVVAFSITRS